MPGHRKPSIYTHSMIFLHPHNETLNNNSLANSAYFFYTNKLLKDQLQNLTHVSCFLKLEHTILDRVYV